MMDFQKLLKKAASNQATKQRELETKIKEVKNEKQTAARQEIEKKREAKKKLTQYEEDIIKQRLSYHGLSSSASKPLNRGEPVKTPSPSTSTAAVSRGSYGKDTTRTNNHSSSSATRHSQAVNNSTKSSKPHLHLSGSKQKAKSSSPQPKSLKKQSCKSSKDLSSVNRTKTPPPGRLKSNKPMPTDFQELLKLAQKNSTKATPSSVSTATSGTGATLPSSSKIGIGRSLLNKQSGKSKELSNKPSEHVTSSRNGEKVKTRETKEGNKPVVIKGQPKDINGRTSKVPHVHVDPTRTKPRVYAYPKPYEGIDRTTNGRPPDSSVAMRGRGNPQYRGRGNPYHRGRGSAAVSRNPNKFYSASARLITDGSSSSKGSMMGYRSTWADQMSEYIHKHKDELMIDGDEYYDEEEFDDFVVDEGETEREGEYGEDYSSAIRSIFGDRYRSTTYDDDDDDIIESSYAQQQFEELRSARIGKMEDDEDIRREREETMRKRKQQMKGNTMGTKKAKY